METQIDTKTIILAALFVNFFMIVLLLGYRGELKKERSANMFIKAKFFQMCVFIAWGLMFFLTAPWAAQINYALLLAGDAFLLTAIVFECLAYLMLINECSASLKVAYLGLLIVFIFIFCLVSFLGFSQTFRIITFSIMAVTLILYTVVLFLLRKGDSFLQRIVGVLYLLIMGAYAARALVAGNVFGVSPAGQQDLQSWLSFSLLVLMILGNNGYVLLAKEQADDKLLALANIDGLTGLLNRRAFIEQTRHALSYFARKRQPVSFLAVDIDHFKSLNQTKGRFTGDAALKTIAGEIRNQLRGYDYLCRYGGDEFAVLLLGSGERDSDAVAERLRSTVESRAVYGEQIKLQITVSIGAITVIPQSTTTIEMLFKLGDWALHEAKLAGGNCLVRAGGDGKGGDNGKTG